jgi:3-deoxy-manno-octulosonate cytidylyltransferase (CMP-KDO synthetase)
LSEEHSIPTGGRAENRVVAFVPARMAATRFPGKPLAKIRGIAIVEHVYRRVQMSEAIDDAWVATCDLEIFDYCSARSIPVLMTSPHHERASERMAEAVEILDRNAGRQVDVAVLVQGDEPMIVPEMMDELLAPFYAGDEAEVFNLIQRIDSEEEFLDANCVKVVFNALNAAMYLSREPIPSPKKFTGDMPKWKQLGIIAFRAKALVNYASLAPSPLEIIESVDVNRLLEHGLELRVVSTEHKTRAVDTPDDLAAVRELMAADYLVTKYK